MNRSVKILVCNLGSTSLKFCLYQMMEVGDSLLAKGGLERVTDYQTAIDYCVSTLMDEGHISDLSELDAVAFKPVIAENVTGCVLMDDEVLQAMESFAAIAPAHNPPYINGVRAFTQKLPNVPMIGLFETAFYQWLDPAFTRYGVPQDWHDRGVRRWGFHGASHKYIAERSAELLGRNDIAERVRQLYINDTSSPVDGKDLRVVSCHLGGSSSVTGVLNGVAIVHSFGMTPQSGLPQNNRVGDIDSMAVPYLLRQGLDLETIERQMTKESGLFGISGVSNDVRDIHEAAQQGNQRAELALNVLVRDIRRWIGASVMEMNGLDALVFTAGIGENDDFIRSKVCENLDFLGIKMGTVNEEGDGYQVLSHEKSTAKVFTISTVEELVIAREASRWLKKNKLKAA